MHYAIEHPAFRETHYYLLEVAYNGYALNMHLNGNIGILVCVSSKLAILLGLIIVKLSK